MPLSVLKVSRPGESLGSAINVSNQKIFTSGGHVLRKTKDVDEPESVLLLQKEIGGLVIISYTF